MTTDPFVALVFFALVLLAVCAFGAYWDWRLTDRMRRSDRKVHRNLTRMMGGPR